MLHPYFTPLRYTPMFIPRCLRGGRLSARVHALQSAEAPVGLDVFDQNKRRDFRHKLLPALR
jgi:hypothetical protein